MQSVLSEEGGGVENVTCSKCSQGVLAEEEVEPISKTFLGLRRAFSASWHIEPAHCGQRSSVSFAGLPAWWQ